MTLLTILAFFFSSWAAIAAPLANHLWQSTLFAAAAALLTLMLRKNHAQTRYWVWLTASAKFLIPFSLLVGVGSHLGWSKAPAITQSGLSVAMQEISQPFALTNPSLAAAPATASALAVLARLLPTLLLVVWFGGCATVLFSWWWRWRRMVAAIRGALPVENGRELEALRRSEESAGTGKHIGLIIAPSAVEPGILGVFRPVLFLPAGISDRLADAQLDAIVTHELCHVRRHDNLAAAVHMLIEAIFWFYPLIWWIGARLVDERERACDEEVLRLGSDPQVYAEGILKVCEFYLESPLFCAAGVTGSNLKKRIEAIMIHRIAHNLDFSRKLLLSAAGLLSFAGPVVLGLLHTPQSRAQSQAQSASASPSAFETATIKPNKTGEPMAGFLIQGKNGRAMMFKPDRFMATNVTLRALIQVAYGVQESQIVGGPAWLGSENYDVEARMDSSAVERQRNLAPEQGKSEKLRMLRALLAERFKFASHRETKELPAYVLGIVDNGPKFHEARPGDTYVNGPTGPDGRPIGGGTLVQPERGKLVGQGVVIAELAKTLSLNQLGRTVVDQTGLKGKYDFTLQWAPDANSDSPHASLLAAMEEQLGLKLESKESPVEVLVVDNAEKPSGN
jgi:uncharacterized protein (TIGR03435 family)